LNSFERQINKLFPIANAEEWDNTGLQIAADNIKIQKVLITLDLNLKVLKYAKKNNFNLIISHHPIIFKNISHIIAYKNTKSFLIKELLISNIALLVAHTNLDKYFYDLLSKQLKLKKIKTLTEEGFGSYGTLSNPFLLTDLVEKIKTLLNVPHLRYTGNDNDPVKTIACIGGGGGAYINQMLLNRKIDAIITSDIKYHTAQLSEELNIPVIDAGHFYTENIMLPELKKKLEKVFKHKITFEINTIKTDPFKFN